jgi:hypothetical protein
MRSLDLSGPPKRREPLAGGSSAQYGTATDATETTAATRDAQALKDSRDEPPEHRNDRRRFLIWACMLGVVPPERVVERVISEIEGTL